MELNMSNQQNELNLLKERADQMGISYSNNIGIEALKQKINEKLGTTQSDLTGKEDISFLERKEKYNNAMKLVRVIVTPNNPSKKDLEGEIFSVANSICSIKRYVPYNNEKGWHIENILYHMLKEKKTQVFSNKTLKDGTSVRVGREIPAYNITVLPPLTEKEKEDLAKAQRARQSIED